MVFRQKSVDCSAVPLPAQIPAGLRLPNRPHSYPPLPHSHTPSLELTITNAAFTSSNLTAPVAIRYLVRNRECSIHNHECSIRTCQQVPRRQPDTSCQLVKFCQPIWNQSSAFCPGKKRTTAPQAAATVTNKQPPMLPRQAPRSVLF